MTPNGILAVVLILAAVVYFLPALIAMGREHTQAGPIIVINLLLGWTLIGWVVALAWSVSQFRRPDVPSEPAAKLQSERDAEARWRRLNH